MAINMPWTSRKASSNGWSAPIEDVKQQIGQHLDHLAQVAAQVGRDVAEQAVQVTQDAGSQAAGAAKDLSGQAVKAGQSAGAQATGVAKEIPVGAAALAQQALKGASQLGKDLRSIRVTREPAPAQRGPDVMPGIALLAGIGGGLAAMYFFDPERGPRRRLLLREQLTKWTRMGQQAASSKAADLRSRTAELANEAKKAVGNVTEAADEAVSEADTIADDYGTYGTGSNGGAYQSVPIEGDEQRVSSEIH
ncbi:MAG: hypothetical protein ABIP53_00295 [Candidatus Limnocylindrales bacterium]